MELYFVILLLPGVMSVNDGNMLKIFESIFGKPPPLPDTNSLCERQNGVKGVCVPNHLCGDTTINRGGFCKQDLDVCCLLNRKDEEDVTCGKRNVNRFPTSTSGNDSETNFAEFPWMVAILKNDKKTYVFLGGGSLIHPQVTITAAHILRGSMFIRAGEWEVASTSETYSHQDVDVEKVAIHEQYNKRNAHYDLALLILSSPLLLSVHIGVMCLPPPGTRAPARTRCLVTGWGKESFETDQFSTILKKVEVPVVDRSYCQNSLRQTRLGRRYKLHESFMCAGGDLKDACTGDGGSPLTCPIPGQENRYMQSGVVSWGIGCGEVGTPAVYTDLTFLRDWIDEQMTARNFSTSSYTY